MAANTVPIFSKQGLNQWIGPMLPAHTTKDLTSGTSYLLCTADATNGSRIERIILQPVGSNIATLMRFWLNNGAVTTTATNQAYMFDVALVSTTSSETASMPAV